MNLGYLALAGVWIGAAVLAWVFRREGWPLWVALAVMALAAFGMGALVLYLPQEVTG